METDFKILIVDDEKELAENMQHILRVNGYTAEFAVSGKIAVAQFKKSSFDLVIVDVVLPDIIGSDVVTKIAEISPTTEFIYITGFASLDSSIEAVKQENVVSYETKPINMDHLLSIIQQLVKRKFAEEASKQAEVVMRESEERFRLLFDKAPLSYQSLDLSGNFIEVNKAWLETFGYKREEVIGHWFGEFLALEYKEAFRKRFPIFKAAGQTHCEFEMVHKNGSRKFIVFEGRIGYELNGDFKQTHCILQNITERKHAEKKLKKANQLQTVLYGISEAATSATDLNDLYRTIHNQLGTIINTSNLYIALYDEETNTVSFPFFVDEVDEYPKPGPPTRGLTEYVLRTGDSLFLAKDDIYKLAATGEIDLMGTPSELWLGAPLITNEKTIGVVAIQSYTDPQAFLVTDLDILKYISGQIAEIIVYKQAEDRIKQSEEKHRLLSEELGKADSMKRLLLDIITHDLKNPIAVISGMAELVIEEQSDNEMFEIIKTSSDQLVQVLDNATVLAQATVGDKIEVKETNLSDLIGAIVKEFKPQADRSGMTIELDIPTKIIIQVNSIISEVFKNYISNAIKYATEGKKVIIDSYDSNEFLTININDFGTTIIEEKRNIVFDRLFQLDDKMPSRGLGLSIVKKIADAHHAEVGVKPNEPTGNTFYIRFLKDVM